MTPVRGTARKAGMLKSSTKAKLSSSETRQADAAREDRLEEIAGVAQSLPHGPDVELRWIEPGLHFAPFQRRGDRRAVDPARRIRRDRGLPVSVLHAVEIEPPLALRQRSLEAQG